MTRAFVTTGVLSGAQLKSQYFVLLQFEDDDVTLVPDQPCDKKDQLEDVPQISLHALLGHSSPKTLRNNRNIKNRDITILIDSRSTYNFIQEYRIF